LTYRKLFVLYYLGKIASDLTHLVDALKFVIHPITDTMCNSALVKWPTIFCSSSSPIAFRLWYV